MKQHVQRNIPYEGNSDWMPGVITTENLPCAPTGYRTRIPQVGERVERHGPVRVYQFRNGRVQAYVAANR